MSEDFDNERDYAKGFDDRSIVKSDGIFEVEIGNDFQEQTLMEIIELGTNKMMMGCDLDVSIYLSKIRNIKQFSIFFNGLIYSLDVNNFGISQDTFTKILDTAEDFKFQIRFEYKRFLNQKIHPNLK